MTLFQKFISLVTALFVIQVGANGRASTHQEQTVSATQHGVIVESVDKESEAEGLGIKPGDIIDGWIRATERGAIHSPFDFAWVEIEQKPRGALSLQGHRGAENLSWKFVTDQFGLKVRPIMRESLLANYAEGVALAKVGKLTEAAETWKRAAAATTGEDPKWLASWFLVHLGQTLLPSQYSMLAGDYFEKAAQRCPQNETRARVEATYLWGRWATGYAGGNKAERIYVDLLRELGQSAKTLSAARVLEGIGQTAYFQDDLAKSEEYLSRSLEFRQELAPKSSAVASSLLWLGTVAQAKGDLSEAQLRLEQAMDIDSRLSPVSFDMAEISNTLGTLADARGELDRAEMYYRKTLAIGAKLGSPLAGTAAMLLNLGEIAQRRGDFASSERYLRESLSISEAIDPELGVAVAAHNNLGSVLIDEFKLDEAELHLQIALKIKKHKDASNIRVSATLEEFGRLEFKRNNLKKAVDYLEEALAIQRLATPGNVRIADTLAELAATKLKAGEVSAAEKYYQEACTIREKLAPESPGYGEVLAGMGSIRLHQGRTADASTLYSKAISVMESQASQLGASYARSIFRVKNATYYRDYVALLIEQGDPDLALDFLERSRARTLLELLDAAHADIRKGVESALLEQQRSLRSEIEAKRDRRTSLLENRKDDDPIKIADKEIAALVTQYQDIEAKIRTSSPEYAALAQPQPLTARQIRRDLLDHDTVLLEYSLGEERSYVFAVTPEATRTFRLPRNSEIQEAALLLHKLLSTRPGAITGSGQAGLNAAARSERELEQASAKLSAMVLGPVAGQLQVKRIVVVADGALQYIPFAMLPDPSTTGDHAHPHRSVPLIVNHEVVNLPSASVLSAIRRQESTRTPQAKTVAIMADPVFANDDPRVSARAASSTSESATRSSTEVEHDTLSAELLSRSAGELGFSRDGTLHFSRLLYTRQEAAGIRSAFPGSKSMAALDFDASRSTAVSPELSQYRIVHFATHGLINSEHPELSGLVFSLVDQTGRQQDGFLQLKDIYNLNLPADLVVLSACETGLGREINGEGLIGLTRGFMYAGAGRVVASLWNVSDVATAQLMANFYRSMEKDKLPPAAALRSAQIAMWKQKRWSSPYFWAAFQIQGDWK
jgi:CHAT domain-containing protein/tetratricopeptide (TPR) repeat protein